MGGEKKPQGMSELGCADGCGRRGCKGWLELGGAKETLGMSELGCAAGNGCGEEAAGDERGWLRGRLRTAWLQKGSGWKWVGRTGMENGCLSAGYVRM